MQLRASLLAAITLLLLAGPAFAQITLQAEDGIPFRSAAYYDVENADGVDTDALVALAAQNGGGQTWDFTGLTLSDQYDLITEVDEGATGPVASDPPFNQATVTYRVRLGLEGEVGDETFYIYYRTDAAGTRRLGDIVTFVIDGEEVIGLDEAYLPDGILEALPTYTFGDSWQSSPTSSNEGDIIAAYEVDGWGAVAVPGVAGTVPALRVKVTRTPVGDPDGADVIYEFRTAQGIVIFLDTDETGFLEPSAQISVADGPTGTASESPADAEGYALATPRPNPARGLVALDVAVPSVTSATVAVYDVLGRTVLAPVPTVLAAGGGPVVVDAGRLPAGPYVVRVDVDGRTLTRPLMVVR